MGKVNVVIVDATGNKEQKVGLPDDIKCGIIMVKLVEKINLDEFAEHFGLTLTAEDEMLIRTAMLAYTNGAQTRQRYAGGPVEVTIDCWEIAFRVQKGSRLRVDISSSNFPEYSIHPNTEELWSEAKDVRKASQTILTGKDYPSRVILPLDTRTEQTGRENGYNRGKQHDAHGSF